MSDAEETHQGGDISRATGIPNLGLNLINRFTRPDINEETPNCRFRGGGMPWYDLYLFGELYRASGFPNLALHVRWLRAGNDPLEDSHDEELMELVEKQDGEIRLIENALQRARSSPASDINTRNILILDIELRAAKLRLRNDLIGDRVAIMREARESGLTREIQELINDHEATLGMLTEQYEDLYPEYEAGRQADLRQADRERFAAEGVPYYEEEPLTIVGPETLVSDISTPVEPSELTDGDQCPICLDNWTSPEDAVHVVRLTCGHLVCADPCIDTWINSLAERCNTCPLCRLELFPRRERQAGDYLRRFHIIREEINNIHDQIRMITLDIEELSDLLVELAPEAIVHTTPFGPYQGAH